MAQYINVDILRKQIDKINCVDYGSIYSYEAHNAARDVLRDIEMIIDEQSTLTL